MDMVTKYKAAAAKYAAQFKIESQHIIDIAASVIMTRDGILPGGNFAQAIVNNDLNQAVGRADDECIKYLRFFVAIKNNLGSYEILNG